MQRRDRKWLLFGLMGLFVFGAVASGLGILFLYGNGNKQVEHDGVAFDVASDGKQIVFSSADGDLYLFHIRTSRVVQLTNTARKEKDPAFSPNGKSIVYAADSETGKGSCIFVCSADGQQVRQLTNDVDASDSMPAYSSDGSQIVFARAHQYGLRAMGGWAWDDWDVYVMNSDVTELRRVTREKYYKLNTPRFLPNDQIIVYSADTRSGSLDLTSTVFGVEATGGQPPKELTKNRPNFGSPGAWGSQPCVAADGGSIAFISDRAVTFHYDILIMNRDGTKPKPLGVTSVSRYNQSPRFLPDGQTVLFLAGTEWNAGSRPIFSLWQVDTEGENPRCIADSGLFTNPLQWTPKR